jgi:hypothetical protein
MPYIHERTMKVPRTVTALRGMLMTDETFMDYRYRGNLLFYME